MITNEFDVRLTARAATFDIALLPHQVVKLRQYAELLLRWNRRINLTALPLAGWPDETLDRLFLEPLAAAHYAAMERAPHSSFASRNPASATDASAHQAWCDLGSGGGSPALPLAVMCPQLRLTMTETVGKKAAFLREAIRTMPVPDATVAGRFEDLADRSAGQFEVVTCRAVSPSDAGSVAQRLLTPSGRLLYFGSSPEGFESLRLLGTHALLGGQTRLYVYGL